MIKIQNDNRGFILFWSLAMSVVVASIALTLVGSAIMVTNSASRTLQKDLTQIEAENLSRIAFNLLKTMVQENNNLTSADLTTALNAKMAPLIKSGYTIKNLSVGIDPNLFISQIPGGPFRGLQSQNHALTMDLVLFHTASRTTAKFDVSAYLGNIYPTQFNFFSFSDLTNLNAIQTVNTSGRIFANDFAYIGNYGGYSPFTMDFFATAGNFNNIPGWNSRIATVQTPTRSSDYVTLPDPIDNNCTNCGGSGLGFYMWALNTWNGQFQDSHFGVQRLDYWFGNDTFLNIPRLGSPPPGGLEKYELAYQADIRIINGVWYLKNPSNSLQWPGLPIWSDHPGSMKAWNENDHEGTQDVGQADIANNLTTLGLNTAWPAGTMPQKFSYYKTNPVTGTIDTSSFQGIVSYGNLQNTTTTGSGNWAPGDFVGDPLCTAGNTCQNCGGGGPVKTKSITGFTPQCMDALGVVGPSPNKGARLLNATRSGFKFGFAEYIAVNHSATSKIWPMNFDLVQFQNALTCSGHPGELGCYFGNGNYMGREFNGIIFINNSWKNQLQMTQYPFMQNDTQVDPEFTSATNNDASQAGVINGAAGPVQNQILPMQLCSDSLKGTGFDSVSGTNHFTIPDCAKYKNHSVFAARTNAVRVINGGIDPTKFKFGLTIYGPAQIYATGDMNPNSDVTTLTSTPWTPLFLASASIIPLSNAWDDSNAPWDQSAGSIYRQARDTRQIMTATYGHDTGPDFDEVWSGAVYEKRGGNVVLPKLLGADNYSFFYWREDPAIQVVYLGPGVFVNPDVMNYLEDPHYQIYNNQPPGMMPVNVLSINSWIKKTRETATASSGP